MTAPRLLAREVLRSAAMAFDVPVETLTGDRLDFGATRPRALACRAIRTLCPHASFPAIGRMLGGRHHTTIIAIVAATDRVLARKPALAATYDRLIAGLTAPADSKGH